MKTVSLLVAVMVVVTAQPGAGEPKKKREARPGAAERWKMPPRLGPKDCDPGRSLAPPDADGWMQYECWSGRNLWMVVYATYGSRGEARKKCVAPRPDPKTWPRMTVLPGFLFSGLVPTQWYCLHNSGIADHEEQARERFEAYKGLRRRVGNKTVELRKDQASLHRLQTPLVLMDASGHPIRTEGTDLTVMNDKVLLTFRYSRRPNYLPKGNEKRCPLPFHGTVAGYGAARRQIGSATFPTDGINEVWLRRLGDGSYVLALQDSGACKEGDSTRSHLFVWSQAGALRDWKTFPGQAANWDTYGANRIPVCITGPDEAAEDYDVQWDGKRLQRVEAVHGEAEPAGCRAYH